jgi:hypothetical protein
LKLAIDVGSAAIDRSGQTAHGWTYLDFYNPANAAGTLDTIEVWAAGDTTGTKVGTFYGSGDDYANRDYELLGDVSSGSKQVYSGLSIDVETGDVIGKYNVTGYLEYATSGGYGIRYKIGDQFDTGQQTYSSLSSGRAVSVHGMGTEGGGAIEKQSSDAGTGADAKISANPVASLSDGESGGGADWLPGRDITLPEAGSGADMLVSLQTPAAKTSSDSGSGADASVSLEVPQGKTSSDTGSGAEAVPVYSAVLIRNESGSGVEAFIDRLLAAAEAGSGDETSEIGGGGLLKHLVAGELGEGADGLTAKIEIPNKGGGMKLWT